MVFAFSGTSILTSSASVNFSPVVLSVKVTVDGLIVIAFPLLLPDCAGIVIFTVDKSRATTLSLLDV